MKKFLAILVLFSAVFVISANDLVMEAGGAMEGSSRIVYASLDTAILALPNATILAGVETGYSTYAEDYYGLVNFGLEGSVGALVIGTNVSIDFLPLAFDRANVYARYSVEW